MYKNDLKVTNIDLGNEVFFYIDVVCFLFYPRGMKKLTVLVMSDHFFLSDQDGVLIEPKSVNTKKLFAALNSRDTFRV